MLRTAASRCKEGAAAKQERAISTRRDYGKVQGQSLLGLLPIFFSDQIAFSASCASFFIPHTSASASPKTPSIASWLQTPERHCCKSENTDMLERSNGRVVITLANHMDPTSSPNAFVLERDGVRSDWLQGNHGRTITAETRCRHRATASGLICWPIAPTSL